MKKKVKYRVLGVMSGTSLDGLDFAICTFRKTNKWKYKIERSVTIPYSKYWETTLKSLHLQNTRKINDIDIEFGIFIGKNIKNFLKNEKVDFIASHGHTVFHQPENNYTLRRM